MNFFHALFSTRNIIRMRDSLISNFDELEDWQVGLTLTGKPFGAPQLLTRAIESYYRMGTDAPQRHFWYVQQMASGLEFYNNWVAMLEMCRTSGGYDGREIKGDLKVFY